jgi:hypothetical protein
MELAAVRLQQHLGDACGSGGIAVDCKNIAFCPGYAASRISQQRIIRGMSDETTEMTMRCLGIEEPCVVIHEVGAAPLRILPVWLLNAPFESDTRRGCQSWSFVW